MIYASKINFKHYLRHKDLKQNITNDIRNLRCFFNFFFLFHL